MRTTVSIDDELLAVAKRRARNSGVSLGTVIEDALRRHFSDPLNQAAPDLPVFHGGSGTLPGVDVDSNRSLAEVLDRDQDINALR